MESNPCRRIQLLGITHPVVGKQFQVLEVRQRMKLIRDLSGEGKVRFSFILYLVKKIWVENPVYVLCKEQRVVIKLVLHDKYILASFPGFPGLCNKKANLY